MGDLQYGSGIDQGIRLHPSVGLSANPTSMTAPQKVAAVSMVRCLEHDLLDGERVRRTLSRDQAERLVGRINELRSALGWLEINLEGKWRWPQAAG